MLRVSDIRNFDVLKQAALLLERAVPKLQNEVDRLRLEIAQLKGQAVPMTQMSLLEEELARLRSEQFGPSSEKRPKSEDACSDSCSEEQQDSKKTGHGPTAQPNLPVETTVWDITEEEKQQVCEECGKPLLEKDGLSQESEMITVVGVEFKLEKVVQKIYGCECPDRLVTAPGPDRVIPGGRYSLEFGVFVAEQKYLDHMPLARIQRMMARKGLDVSRSTLFDQILSVAELLKPTWKALHEYTLSADWAHCDETYWPMLDGSGTSKWWAWCLASDDSVFYAIHKHRSTKAARAVLGGFSGVLITDGYSAYNALIKAGPENIVHAHCWAHVRRKFLEAEQAYPEESKKPIQWIGRLFEIERTLPKLGGGESLSQRAAMSEQRKLIRQQQSRPVVNELRQWAYDILPTLLPSSSIAKAVKYMLKLWQGLTVFLDDPRIPIDNNHAEREIRGVVVGRKNHYGSKSKRGAEVSAIFYTLFESAKLVGVDPSDYVLEAARRAIRNPGTITLPHEFIS
jgi:transposase